MFLANNIKFYFLYKAIINLFSASDSSVRSFRFMTMYLFIGGHLHWASQTMLSLTDSLDRGSCWWWSGHASSNMRQLVLATPHCTSNDFSETYKTRRSSCTPCTNGQWNVYRSNQTRQWLPQHSDRIWYTA